MSTGTNRLLDCPEWDPLDPHRVVKKICWHTLVDAMKKSIMCNDLRDLQSTKVSGGTLSGRARHQVNSSMTNLIESRNWLLDFNNREHAKFGVDDCMDALHIREHTLKSLLRGLWLRRDKYVCGTLNKTRRKAQGLILRQQREHGAKRPGRVNGKRTLVLADKALFMVRESHKRIGVES